MMKNTTNQPTPIETMAAAMSGIDTERLLEIIAELRDVDGIDERIVKYGAYEVLEARYPAIVPMLEEWCSDLEDDRDYETMTIDAVIAVANRVQFVNLISK